MPRDPIGFIYFIQAPINERIKIGYSANHPAERVRAIDAMSPVEIVPLAVARGLLAHEAALHRLLGTFAGKGEWFEGHALVRKYTKEMALPWEQVDALVAARPTETEAYRWVTQWSRSHFSWAEANGLDPDLVRPTSRGYPGIVMATSVMARTFRFQRPLLP